MTTDAAQKYLKEADLMEPVMERIMDKMEFYVTQRAQHQLELGVITFSNVFGILGQSKKVPDLVKNI